MSNYVRIRTGSLILRSQITAFNLYQISYTPSVKHIVGSKTLPFCSKISSPILVTSWSSEKDTGLSSRYIFAFRESLGRRLVLGYRVLCNAIDNT